MTVNKLQLQCAVVRSAVAHAEITIVHDEKRNEERSFNMRRHNRRVPGNFRFGKPLTLFVR